MKKHFQLSVFLVALVSGIALGVFGMTGFFIIKLGGIESFPYAVKFAAIYSAIEREYVGDADMKLVADSAYSAMVDSISDRWSYYMNSNQYDEYKQYQKNSYSGIGVTIHPDERSGLYKVVTIIEDSPASRAGVNIGDLMFAIDGVPLKDRTSADIKKIISEKEGEFQLTLLSEQGTERTVTVSTELVYSKPVSHEMLEENIGYIRIKNFETNSGNEINSAIDKLISEGAEGIVFDVRNNPGGLLSELLKTLDYILPEGDIFVSADKDGNEKIRKSDASSIKIPMAVIINENSYSAAEFFGAALSEYDWATLVGTNTTGKARSQINIVLFDGSAVHLSTNSYLTPKRVDLSEEGGLKPDIEVIMEDEDKIYLIAGLLERDKDVQLKSAIKAVKEQVDK